MYEGNEITPGIQPYALRGGRSLVIASQIFSDFDQVRAVVQYFPGEFMKTVDIVDFYAESVLPLYDMQANCRGRQKGNLKSLECGQDFALKQLETGGGF